ncbi:MAG: dTDP-4-dehydrorhamnose 3,5-epimerase family protein [Actinomycetota bacterium]
MALPSERTISIPYGARVVDLTTRADDRGAFTEVFRQEWFPGARVMVQSNLSRSRAGVLRGLHFHRRQADYWCVLEGTAFVALVDLRAGSPTERSAWWRTFDASDRLRGLYVPPGVAHGFYAVTTLRCSTWSMRRSPATTSSASRNDPDAAIPWPGADPVVSVRDASNPPMADVMGDAPACLG